MTKNTHFVISVQRGGKFRAYMQSINNSNNLMYKFPSNASSINVADSKKEAVEIVNCWNNSWKREGKLLPADEMA